MLKHRIAYYKITYNMFGLSSKFKDPLDISETKISIPIESDTSNNIATASSSCSTLSNATTTNYETTSIDLPAQPCTSASTSRKVAISRPPNTSKVIALESKRHGKSNVLLNENIDDDDVKIIEPEKVVIDLCEDEEMKAAKIQSVVDGTINKTTFSVDVKTLATKETVSLTPENIQTVCRICLKQNEVVNLFETFYEKKSFGELLLLCSNVKLLSDETLSRNICHTCLAELLQSYYFREKCEKSENTLQNFKQALEEKEAREKKYAGMLDKYKNHTLRFHDYENSLTEEQINNINVELPSIDDVNMLHNGNLDANSDAQATVRRFYLLQGDLSGKIVDGKVNITEINENNAKTLIADNKATVQLKVGNAICSIKTSTENKGLVNPTTLKNLLNRRRKVLPHSQILKPLNSYRDGQVLSTNYTVKAKKPVKKRQRPRKTDPNAPRDKKPVIPGECHVCGEAYATLQEHKEHSRITKHYLNPYECKICNIVYPSKHRLKIHTQLKHDARRPHMCDVCGKTYKTRSYLLKHITTHKQTGYACRTCKQIYPSLRELVHHRRETHRDAEKRIHCCEFCGDFFARKDSLRHHRDRIHLKIERILCHQCGKGFQFKSLLMKHMKSHSTSKFDCKLCNRTFKEEDRYRNHLKVQHPGADENASQIDEIQVMDCLYCELLCRNKQLQTMHIRQDHDVSICLYCDTRFDSENELKEHAEKLHADILGFCCRYCGKAFEEANELFSHLDVHRTKTYQCQHCTKCFVNQMRLNIHNVIHTREKRYHCRYCENAFLYNTSRTIHERLHTGERPYVCDICGKGCVCISSYKRHRRTHILPLPIIIKVEEEDAEAVSNIQ